MRRMSALLLIALGLSAAAVIFGVGSALAGGSRNVPVAGTGGPQTGPFTPWDGSAGPEFPAGEESDEGPAAFGGAATAGRSRTRRSGRASRA